MAGHLGREKTLGRLAAVYAWRGQARDVHLYCAICEVCKRAKPSTRKPIGLLHPLPPAEDAWSDIQVDYMSKLPETERGNDTLFVAVDRYTRRIHATPTKATVSAEETAEILLERVVRHHGIPKSITSDRDARFTSEVWRSLLKRMGTKLQMSTAYHPQTNGLTERANRTIIGVLRAFCEERKRDWDRSISLVEIAYNTAKQR